MIKHPYRHILLLLLVATLPMPVLAASFDVAPIKVYFDPQKKVENLRITNLTEESVSIQLSAFDWRQDADGRDVYESTEELVYFPKIFLLEGKKQKLIKLGFQNSGELRNEKTLRLYVEELPQAIKEKSPTLHVALKVGLPIFIAPDVPAKKEGRIDNARVSHGKFEVAVANPGNVHFQVTKVNITGYDAGGNDFYKDELNGWYILAGMTRTFSLAIPADECRKLARATVEISTQEFTLKDEVSMENKTCE